MHENNISGSGEIVDENFVNEMLQSVLCGIAYARVWLPRNVNGTVT